MPYKELAGSAAGAAGGYSPLAAVPQLCPSIMSKRKERDEKRKAQIKAKVRAEQRQSRRTFQEQQEVAALDEAIAAGAPAPGSNPMALEGALPGTYAGSRTFEELPLSQYTKTALKEAGYTQLTAIQRAALPHALAGRDILGAAKTGSGKTLCFLIPVSVIWGLSEGCVLSQGGCDQQ